MCLFVFCQGWRRGRGPRVKIVLLLLPSQHQKSTLQDRGKEKTSQEEGNHWRRWEQTFSRAIEDASSASNAGFRMLHPESLVNFSVHQYQFMMHWISVVMQVPECPGGCGCCPSPSSPPPHLKHQASKNIYRMHEISRNGLVIPWRNAVFSHHRTLAKKKQSGLIPEAFKLAPVEQNYRPIDRDYASWISQSGKAGFWQDAFALFGIMTAQGVPPNVFTYTAAISACTKGGQWQSALVFFQAMLEEKVVANVMSYSAIISACEKGGQWQRALAVFQTMSEEKVVPNVVIHRAIISACKKVVPNVMSYSAIISACTKGGQWQSALFFFQAMLEEKVVPNVVSYSAIISACERGGQWQRALALFQTMPEEKVVPNVVIYRAIISACRKVVPDVVSYTEIISAFEKGSQWQRALALFQTMPEEKVVPNVVSYSAIISACEKGGQWQRALALFQTMPEEKVVPNVVSYSAIISACEKGGQWQRALALFQTMPEEKVVPNVVSYSAIISAFEKGSQWQRALALFQTMPEEKVVPNVVSYGAVMNAFVRDDQWQQSLAMLSLMLNSQVEGNIVIYNALFDCPSIRSSGLGSSLFQGFLPLFRDITVLEELELDLHILSQGSTCLTLKWWLATTVKNMLVRKRSLTCRIVTGWGKTRKAWDTSDLRATALEVLHNLGLQAKNLVCCLCDFFDTFCCIDYTA